MHIRSSTDFLYGSEGHNHTNLIKQIRQQTSTSKKPPSGFQYILIVVILQLTARFRQFLYVAWISAIMLNLLFDKPLKSP